MRNGCAGEVRRGEKDCFSRAFKLHWAGNSRHQTYHDIVIGSLGLPYSLECFLELTKKDRDV